MWRRWILAAAAVLLAAAALNASDRHDAGRETATADVPRQTQVDCRPGDLITSSNPLYLAGSGPGGASPAAAIEARHIGLRPRRLVVEGWRPTRGPSWHYAVRGRRVIATMSVYRVGDGWRGGAMSFCGEYAELIGA